MTTITKLYTLVLGSLFSYAFAQVGINTASPTKTLDVNGDMRIRQMNTLSESSVLTLDNNGNVYKADGVKLLPDVGEIKYGMQKADHAGWYLLNGRTTASITSTVARANAISLGFATALYDSRNRYIKDTNETIGTVNGNNTYTLTQANMPAYTLAAGVTGSSGDHNHTGIDVLLGSPGDAAGNTGVQTGATPYFFQPTTRTITTSTNTWNHNHTASATTGGSSQAFSIEPDFITANVFIYLGQ